MTLRRFSLFAFAAVLIFGFGFGAHDAQASCSVTTEGANPPNITAMSVSLSGDQNTLTVNYTVNAGGGCDGGLDQIIYNLSMDSSITGTGLTAHDNLTGTGRGVGLTGSQTMGVGLLLSGQYTVVLSADNHSGFPADTESRTFTINRPTFTLTATKTGNGSGTVTGNPAGIGGDDINCGSNCDAPFNSGTSVSLTASPAGDSTFIGWSNCSGSTNPTISVTMNANKTCTARFDSAPSTYTLTVTKTGSGTVTGDPAGVGSDDINCGSNCDAPFNSGTSVSLTASPAGGWNFDHWTGCNTGTNPSISVTMNANKTCNAIFSQEVTHYRCAADSCVVDPAGPYTTSNCDDACGTPQGTRYACNAGGACVETEGGPYDAPNCNDECTVPPAGPYTLDVTKSGTGTGRVTGNPAGIGGDDINCGTNCSAPFNDGANVSLTASADLGSIFYRWSNCRTGVNPGISVTMDADKTCDARFNTDPDYCADPATITVTSNMPTTWHITGPEAFHQFTPATGASYETNTQGTYTIAPGNIAGYTRVVTPAASQTIANCGQGISFTITYTQNPPDTLYACNVAGSCVVTAGGPYTTSNCNNECVIPPSDRYACNDAGSCVVTAGGPYTTSNCDNACVSGPPSGDRYACNREGSCVVTAGGPYTTSNCNNACDSGATRYSCSGAGGACVADPSGAYTTANCNNACSVVVQPSCTFTAAPKIISVGGSSTLTWECSGVTSCVVRNLETNAIVVSSGPDGNTAVSPAETTEYGLTCVNGPFSTSTTVRVLTVQECNPGDPDCNP